MRKPKSSWFETLVGARRILRPCPPESRRPSTSRTADSARALTFPSGTLQSPLSTIQSDAWPVEHCANEPEPFFTHLAIRSTFVLLAVLVLIPAPTAFSAVHHV